MHQINLFTLISTRLHAIRHKIRKIRTSSKSNLDMLPHSVVNRIIMFHILGVLVTFVFTLSSTAIMIEATLIQNSLELKGPCNASKCLSPSAIDPHLQVEIVYQGNFSFEYDQVSPVSAMAFLNNDILILNKNNGTVLKLENHSDGTYHATMPLLDVEVANKQERGLLGITVLKDENKINVFGKNNLQPKYVFLYFTESKKNDGSDICQVTFYCDPSTSPLGNRIYRYELQDNKLQNPKLLLDLPATPAPGHNGGAIELGPDSNLYVTVGDLVGLINHSSSTKAQNFKNGTDADGRAGILRITQDGKEAKSIIGNSYPLDRYFAYGIRNSFGIDFDPVTGYLWDTENGPHYGDEINLVRPGFNSGWNVVQGIWRPVKPDLEDFIAGDQFSNRNDLVDFGGKGKYSNPEFTWKNTTGPSGMTFLDSDKLGKKYENDLFVGSFNLGVIFHFDLNSNRTGLDLEGMLNDKIADSNEELKDVIFLRGLGRITDVEVGPEGYLYVLSNYANKATIFRIMPT